MNERIRELIKQAGGRFSTHTLTSYPAQRRESIELWDKNIEKFAQLIVQECMFQIKEEHNLTSYGTEPAGPYAHGFDDGMFVAIKTIQEHFGVNEE